MQKNNASEIFTKTKKWFIFFVFALALGFFYFLLGCPIKYFTGISCAGCGMIRAVFECSRLNFSKAFYYHPLVFGLPIFLFSFFMSLRQKEKKEWKILLLCFVGLFFVVYFCRMIVGEGNIVSISCPGFVKDAKWVIGIINGIK